MQFYEFANRIVRSAECALISLVLGAYALLIYISIMKDRSICSSYLIVTSFTYYVILLVKSPGSLLDLGDASVRGLCTICNRVRGNKTRHCYVCSKCYDKLDHHCMLTGKCIAQNNIREFYLCIVFTLLFTISWLVKKNEKVVPCLAMLVLLGVLMWYSMCIALNMTGSELLKHQEKRIEFKHLKRIAGLVSQDPLGLFFPILRSRCKVEY